MHQRALQHIFFWGDGDGDGILGPGDMAKLQLQIANLAPSFMNVIPQVFDTLDLDNDGYVSTQEFSQHRETRMAARAAQGRLLRNAGQAPRFERWDANGDGLLSPAELTSGQQARSAGQGGGGRPCWRYR